MARPDLAGVDRQADQRSEMSLMGPRPAVPYQVDQDKLRQRRLRMQPGCELEFRADERGIAER
jgi:hypothetical protein